MRDRIWNDLRNTFFYIEYLSLHINKEKRKNKIIETVLLATSLIGIAGWNKFSSQYVIWTILLSIVVAIRILKSRFMVSETEIGTFQRLKDFYLDHIRSLDDLWYKYENEKITEKQAEKLFAKFNEEERLIIKIEKHDKIFGLEPLKSKAELLATERLKKYT